MESGSDGNLLSPNLWEFGSEGGLEAGLVSEVDEAETLGCAGPFVEGNVDVPESPETGK